MTRRNLKYVSSLFTNTVLLPMQCGGHRMSIHAHNQCCNCFLFRLCLCEIYPHLIYLNENVIFVPRSLGCYFGVHVLDRLFGKFCGLKAPFETYIRQNKHLEDT